MAGRSEVDHPAKEGEKLETVGHGGGINGFNTIIERIPGDDHLIVLLNNTPSANLGKIVEGIRSILYGEQAELPLEPLSRELYRSYSEGDIEAAVERYQEIKKNDADRFDMTPGQLVRFAAYLKRAERIDDEIVLWELTARERPRRAEPLTALADALARAGRREEAVKAYGRALEVNPKIAKMVTNRLDELSKEER